MKKSRLLGAVCAVIFAVISMPSHAALTYVLGGQAVYDDVADLTWLADANYAQTSGYDTDGLMNWATANAWAAALDIDGVTGWHLPTRLTETGSEMGNMFYNVLGGVAGSPITTTHNSNYDLFSNVQSNVYWSSTEYAPTPSIAWTFYFFFGEGYNDKDCSCNNAWAVQSGNVGAVPVPAAVWLFSFGLLGLVGIARRKAA